MIVASESLADQVMGLAIRQNSLWTLELVGLAQLVRGSAEISSSASFFCSLDIIEFSRGGGFAGFGLPQLLALGNRVRLSEAEQTQHDGQ